MTNDKYKIGDEVCIMSLVKMCSRYSCEDCNCKDQVGTIVIIDERDTFRYTVNFKNIVNGMTGCGYNEEEISLNTQKDKERYWLMKYKD